MSKSFQMLAAPHTPFHPNGDLHLEIVARQADHFRANAIDGGFVCGTTGEGLSLTNAERKSVAEAWMHVAGSDLKIIIHAGHNCQRDAVDLSAHAKSIGAHGVAAVAPHFLKPKTPADLVAFFAPIAAACDPLPFYFYDLPSLTNVMISAAKIIQSAKLLIPNFGGIKYTNADCITLQECLAFEGIEVYFGVDELLLAGLALGVRCAVGSTYNFTSNLHRKIIAAYESNEMQLAQTLQRKSVAMIRVLENHGGMVRAGKATMAKLGIDCGPTRWPLAPMEPDEMKVLHAELEKLEIGI